MSYFAEIDNENTVLRVVACNNDDPNGDEGYQWLLDNLGGTWIKTSFNATIRKNFAQPGGKYDPERDAFIHIQPSPDCVLDPETLKWVLPTGTGN